MNHLRITTLAARLVLRLLTLSAKTVRAICSKELARPNAFLSRVVTGYVKISTLQY